MIEKKSRFHIMPAGFVVLGGVLLTLFAHWELTAESWGYWFFARIFAETGRFLITGRCPMYTLYLNIFRPLGYPYCVVAEYIVTALVVSLSLILLFRRYIGLFYSSFAVFLWLPFLQISEPYVQNLALASSALAVIVRQSKADGFRKAFSYALLGLASMLKLTYVLFIFVFLFWDIVKLFKIRERKSLLQIMRPKLYIWPVLLVLALSVWFRIMQSPHRWNNAWFITSKWFPGEGKKVSDAVFIQNYNWQHIFFTYGTYKDIDFYFTNQELFNGATTIVGAVRANPKFVAEQMILNTKNTLCTAVGFTMLPPMFYSKSPEYPFRILMFGFTIPLVLIILYGAFRACKSEGMILFLIANLFIIGALAISLPSTRYMHPLIPVLILSASWYGKKIAKSIPAIGRIGVPLVLILFSNGLGDWTEAGTNLISDIRQKEIRLLERRPYSMKASFGLLQPLIQDCKGVLVFEGTFIGAFLDIPVDKLYDIWEIPPFGHFGNSDYKGLYPDRIDCVLVSYNLVHTFGFGTNSQIRYENYILPYVKNLHEGGAKVYNIQEFGQVYRLPKPKY